VVAMTDSNNSSTTNETHAVTFGKIRDQMLKTTGQLFDVIHMDPPWQLATANPTRGVALGYSQLSDRDIKNLPIPSLQKNGLLFIWVINAKYRLALKLIKHWVCFYFLFEYYIFLRCFFGSIFTLAHFTVKKQLQKLTTSFL
jgi:hypothetical protein